MIGMTDEQWDQMEALVKEKAKDVDYDSNRVWREVLGDTAPDENGISYRITVIHGFKQCGKPILIK